MSYSNLTAKETFDLAVKKHRKNNFTEAKNLYQKVIEKNSNFVDAYNNLGIVFKELREFNKAINCYEKVININSEHIGAYINLGNVFKELGQYNKSISYYEKAIKINPNYFKVLNNLGSVLHEIGEFQKSINYYEKAIENNPNYLEAYINLGNVLKEKGEIEKAISCYEKAISIKFDSADAHNNLGNVLKEKGEIEKAISCYEKAISIQPKYIMAYTNLMDIYKRTNLDEKLEEIILNVKKFFTNDSKVKLYEGVLLYKKENYIESANLLEKIIFTKKQLNYERIKILTLAKCYDQIQEVSKAFINYKKINELSLKEKRIKNFDKNIFLKQIKNRTDFYNNSKIKEWDILNHKNERSDPIFMIGFPRSGTTLLDTILRSHPLIEVIEEKSMVGKLIDCLSELPNGAFEGLSKIDNTQLKKIRKTYFDTLDSHIQNKKDSKIYIDKLPLNIVFVGEIVRIFPNAKFILSLRHPCDCVLSCFMQDFKLNNAMANFLSLEDSANLYKNVMNLWSIHTSIFSINYHQIKYENLITNFETTVNQVLKFLELPWDDSLFQYYNVAKERRLISTPSYGQVIKPIYSNAIGRWKRYKEETSKVYPMLEPWIKKFNY